MKFFRRLYFNHHLKKYVQEMPFYMLRKYGIKEFYRPEDVKYIAVTYGFTSKYIGIGYAMFCDSSSFNLYSSSTLDKNDLDEIRQIILRKYFPENRCLTLVDLMAISSLQRFDEYWEIMKKLDEDTPHQLLRDDSSQADGKIATVALNLLAENTLMQKISKGTEMPKYHDATYKVFSVILALAFIGLAMYLFDLEIKHIPWCLAWVSIGLGAIVLVVPIVFDAFSPIDENDETNICMLVPAILWLVVPASIFLLVCKLAGWAP